MNKVTLAMLLGAACSSAWWAAARWPRVDGGSLYAVAIFLSVGVLVWLFVESVKAISSE